MLPTLHDYETRCQAYDVWAVKAEAHYKAMTEWDARDTARRGAWQAQASATIEHGRGRVYWMDSEARKAADLVDPRPELEPPRMENPRETFTLMSPATVWYDDIKSHVNDQITAYNRIVTILQGIFDRSTAFAPHRPWPLWTTEGFEEAIVLVHDTSRAIPPGPPPSFKDYCARGRKTIRVGTHVIGQERAWGWAERARSNAQALKNPLGRERELPNYPVRPSSDNPGPGYIAKVASLRGTGEKARATFTYQKQSNRRGEEYHVPCPDKPGYHWVRYRESPMLDKTYTCPVHPCEELHGQPHAGLFNVDAYKPGDWRVFFDDPRTRANYLEWAPLMLEAEEWHAQREGRMHLAQREAEDRAAGVAERARWGWKPNGLWSWSKSGNKVNSDGTEDLTQKHEDPIGEGKDPFDGEDRRDLYGVRQPKKLGKTLKDLQRQSQERALKAAQALLTKGQV